jgi:hypothetical protein
MTKSYSNEMYKRLSTNPGRFVTTVSVGNK